MVTARRPSGPKAILVGLPGVLISPRTVPSPPMMRMPARVQHQRRPCRSKASPSSPFSGTVAKVSRAPRVPSGWTAKRKMFDVPESVMKRCFSSGEKTMPFGLSKPSAALVSVLLSEDELTWQLLLVRRSLGEKKVGVGQPEGTVRFHDDIVRSVQPLALEAFSEHLDLFSLGVPTSQQARLLLHDIKPSRAIGPEASGFG